MTHIQAYMALESTREERYEMKDMNIQALCEGILNKAKESFRPDVVATLSVPRVNVRTNAEALENILLYLLGNAASHTESGKITLEFKKRSAHSGQFIVTDTGCGIPEEKRASLFKPFTEVQDLTKGDGLGLPTCALMAYKLNGILRLDEDYKKAPDLFWNCIRNIFTFHHRLHGLSQILINYGTHISVNIHVIQSVAKNLENILVDILAYVTEILPPFGRLTSC
jgi:signal transduction histidine kinase